MEVNLGYWNRVNVTLSLCDFMKYLYGKPTTLRGNSESYKVFELQHTYDGDDLDRDDDDA